METETMSGDAVVADEGIAAAEAAQGLAELQQLFGSRLLGDAAKLSNAAAWLASEAKDEAEMAVRIARLVHTLAGTAGVFGFAQISEAAAAVEAELASVSEHGPDREAVARSIHMLAQLCQAEAEKLRLS